MSSKDMAICFCFFNPAESKRILMNYLYIKNMCEIQKLPYYTIELVYDGKQPEISDSIVVKSNSYMFHKENLLRVLEKKIPEEFTKLAFLDSDVFFSDKEWYNKTSELLNTNDVVQPFEDAIWLDLTYKKEQLSRKSAVMNNDKCFHWMYHTGFALCMRRDWYRNIGFFDYAISGSSDSLSMISFMKQTYSINYSSLPRALMPEYKLYYDKPQPRITYLKKMKIYHLFHGSKKNRQYTERHKLLNDVSDVKTLITTNEDGVFEWIDKDKWNPLFLRYFKERGDDDLND